MRMHVCVCIDEAKTVSLRTGRAGDIFGQMGRRGDNTWTTPPLAMGRRDGNPNYYTLHSYYGSSRYFWVVCEPVLLHECVKRFY